MSRTTPEEIAASYTDDQQDWADLVVWIKRYGVEMLKAACAAMCEDCEHEFSAESDSWESRAWRDLRDEWWHGSDDGSGTGPGIECNASPIRAALDPEGKLLGGLVMDSECDVCGFYFRAEDGHECEEG
jgi:hypothetical protein